MHQRAKSVASYTGRSGIVANRFEPTVKRGAKRQQSLKLDLRGAGLSRQLRFGGMTKDEGLTISRQPGAFPGGKPNLVKIYLKFPPESAYSRREKYEAEPALQLSKDVIEIARESVPDTIAGKDASFMCREYDGDVTVGVQFDIDNLFSIPRDPKDIEADIVKFAEWKKEYEAAGCDASKCSEDIQKHVAFVERAKREMTNTGSISRLPEDALVLPQLFVPFGYRSFVQRLNGYVIDPLTGKPKRYERTINGKTTFTNRPIYTDAFFSDLNQGTVCRVHANVGSLFALETFGFNLYGDSIIIIKDNDSTADEVACDDVGESYADVGRDGQHHTPHGDQCAHEPCSGGGGGGGGGYDYGCASAEADVMEAFREADTMMVEEGGGGDGDVGVGPCEGSADTPRRSPPASNVAPGNADAYAAAGAGTSGPCVEPDTGTTQDTGYAAAEPSTSSLKRSRSVAYDGDYGDHDDGDIDDGSYGDVGSASASMENEDVDASAKAHDSEAWDEVSPSAPTTANTTAASRPAKSRTKRARK